MEVLDYLQFENVKILVCFAVLVIGFVELLVISLYKRLVVKPERLREMLRKQGISGPPQTMMLGNIREIKKAQAQRKKVRLILSTIDDESAAATTTSISHNVDATLFPFFEQWRKQYGEVFVFSLGNTQILHVTQPNVVREIITCTSLDLGKPSYQQKERGPLLGQGILTSNGAAWSHQRKILAPEFYKNKVKGMMSLITESTMMLLTSWNSRIEKEGGIANIKIDGDMRSFSGDLISRACFGSNYSKGEEIFLKLRALQEIMSKKSLSMGIPGMRYLPTKSNRNAWELEKEIHNLILKVVKERKQEAAYEKDLLQMILEGAKSSNFSQEETDQFIVDNCKNIYLAGFETTAVSSTWCLMLLACNQEWQDRVRAEVLEICQGQTPDYEMLNKMKQLTMVIQETLRLYPPVSVVSREAFKDMIFGGINIPKGVNVWTLVSTLHTDPKIWGPDAYKFNPERFSNGSSTHLYMPFGVGPRVCLGQNLAMVELKMLMALLLSKFSFSLSPKYVHSPTLRLVIEPEHGVQLLVKKLQDNDSLLI
ncbi:hypothetical protein LWI28_008264 [Acer negundo]|uniref:Cytochrome P450 n=1 Tax=Acer negundo TaxID=4023 RepID=A0AAD5JG40_ACENE|nr:hypothetical protein LWI28_008264 [Acer negundo]KAK4858611.1 hypothetical protein QYF36_019338 [Acer negundo]